MISLVVNPAALAPHADGKLSSGKMPYSWRTYALRNFLLPSYTGDRFFDEVIVAGVWEDGPGYTYIPVPQEHHSWRDCIAQRQAGFEASHGDIVIHQHDDHWVRHIDGLNLAQWIGTAPSQFDVLTPQRCTRLRNSAGERLNHGEHHYYIGGHCAVYRREVLERCPWKSVPRVFTMDVEHSRHIREAGFTIGWTDALKVWDVEYGSTPWR